MSIPTSCFKRRRRSGRWIPAPATPTAPCTGWLSPPAFTLLTPFHLSTRWILLKSLTPVNTVKRPESELLSCRQRQRMTSLSPRMGVYTQAHPQAAPPPPREQGCCCLVYRCKPSTGGDKRRRTWGLSRRDTPLKTTSVLENVPFSLPDSSRVWFSSQVNGGVTPSHSPN